MFFLFCCSKQELQKSVVVQKNSDSSFVFHLTENQKILFDTYKNDKEAMEKLSKITHNKAKWQFEFQEAKLALNDKDIAIKNLWNGWKLPGDVDFGKYPEKQNKLNPEESDFDKMIMDMPGETDNEKVENFRLLTGVSEWYQTSQDYNKSSSGFVIRRFREGDRSRCRDSDGNDLHVRGVRPL